MIQSLGWSPDGKAIALICGDGTVQLLVAKSGKEVLDWKAHPDYQVEKLAFHPDGKTIATCCYSDCAVREWDANTGKQRIGREPGTTHASTFGE